MEARITGFIRKEGLIHPGERILLALSGGPDSVCLFHLLLSLREKLDFQLGLAHVNHGLRGSESDEDEAFVRELARRFDVPLHVIAADVPELQRILGEGMEAAARKARYDFFARIMDVEGYDKTALAHNMNDQAETILHRLLRGSGLNGLAGMRPMREERYIRPLLEIRRSDIEAWLEKNAFSFRIDSTNLVPGQTRNRIRLELLPALQKYNPDLVGTLSAMSRSLASDRDYLEEEALKRGGRFMKTEGEKIILLEEAFSLPQALSSRLVMEAVSRLRGSRSDIHAGHVLDALALQRGETGKSLDLGGGVIACNHYGRLEFTAGGRKETAPGEIIRVDLQALPLTVDLPPYQIHFRIESREEGHDAGASKGGELDASMIKGGLIIRRRRSGDLMQPLGMKGRRKVKSIFIDRKIHRSMRDLLPVITDGSGEIAYIHPGITGEAFRIDTKTDKIVYITVTEKDHA